ncbi:MAG: hypothetical protein Q9170_000096 [Blastenia crenularia]
MTREAAFLAKREDLKKCTQTHSSLLLELYRSTTILANIKKQSLGVSGLLDTDLDGEQTFLEANNLSLGYYFNLSTLPPLSPKTPQKHVSPLRQSENDTHPHNFDESSASKTTTKDHSPQPTHQISDQDLSLPPTSLDSSSLTRSSIAGQTVSTQASPPLDDPTLSHAGTDRHERDIARQSGATSGIESSVVNTLSEPQTVNPLDTAPLPADDAGGIPESVTTLIEAETRPGGARTVHLPPKAEQEERLRSIVSGNSHHGRRPSSGSDLNGDRPSAQLPSRPSPQNTSQLDENSSLQATAEPNLDDGSNQMESAGVLESQMIIARTDAATGGSPFTPDERLRFKAAGSVESQTTISRTGTPPQEPSGSAAAKDSNSKLDEMDQPSEAPSRISDLEIKSLQIFGREQQQQAGSASETSGLRNHAHPGMARDVAKDITLSQRPPMRIDTGISADLSKASTFKKPLDNSNVVGHTPPDSATSARASQSSAQAQSPPERMTTRVSSGALRHKSVSEILGEIPKPVTPHLERAPTERVAVDTSRDDRSPSRRLSFSGTSPDPAAFWMRLNELKEKDKSKLSTVVFSRKQKLQSNRQSDKTRFWESDAPEVAAKNPEYLLPLFHAHAASPPRAQLLNRLIGSASKTLTTANQFVDYHEQQDCRILSRIDQLQKANRWSLRQLERSAEPERPTVHWDVVLSQMKWLRTDFREERKWKIAAASSLASWCAQWVASPKDQRLTLQIKARSPPSATAAAPESTPTPDLIPSAEDDSSDAAEDDADDVDLFPRKAPAAIFSMAPEMFYFGLERTPSADKLLQELPLYQPSLEIQQAALGESRVTTDKEWKTKLIPVSRFGEGKLINPDEGPPRKKSRYDYAELDEDSRLLLVDMAASDDKPLEPQPERDDVALFNPENKHIRDRIHAGHAFRPPSEYVMPSQSFFESRHSSQWTQVEDDELRRLVREYAYNWSLISSCLSFPSAFSSGAERRTPWECFERWISLEGLPAEMAKTQYFRAYQQRLQAAQTSHETQQHALQQQQAGNVSLRRRSTQPFLVERRRNMRHVHLVNAMKNLARKREAAVKKPERAIEAAAIRKAASAVQPRHPMQTPQEFSRLRHEHDLKMHEQARMYRMQVLQQQKVHGAQRAGGQSSQHANGVQPGRNAVQGLANGSGPAILVPNGQTHQNVGNQRRPPQMPRASNGVQTNGSFPANQQGIPHAPMQPTHIPAPARIPPQMGSDNMRVFQEVSRVQAEQQRFLQQQRQQQQQHAQVNGQTSPNLGNSNFMPPNGSSNHANFQRRSGSPSVNGAPTPNGSSSSPRMTNPPQPQALSSGMMPTINQIMSQLRARNPSATHEQISQMATERLKQYHVQHSHAHAAMQAAAGSSANVNGMNGNPSGSLQAPSQQQPVTAMMNASPLTTTQQCAQMIRNQQQHQQNRASATPYSGQQSSSRGATPQIHRTPSAQGSHPSPSLLPSQTQVAGGQ